MSTTAGTPTASAPQGSPSTITQKSDFLAAEEIKGILAGRDKAEQERIMRWVAESLSLSHIPKTPSPAVHGVENPTQSAIIPPVHTPRTGSAPTSKNIKSFVDEKKPKNDLQFAAIVAYFHRFEAADEARKETIGSEDLQDAARLASWSRFTNPSSTLNNAVKQGYLDRSERGQYKLNPVGENLVAMALPGTAEAVAGVNHRRRGVKRKTNGKRTKTKPREKA
jgi:hypothetical protein